MKRTNPAVTGTDKPDPYASPLTTTDREKALYKSVACGLASQGMLYDRGLKEAVYGMVRIDLIMWERELASLRAQLSTANSRFEELATHSTARVIGLEREVHAAYESGRKTPRDGGSTNCHACSAVIPQGALCADCWAKRAYPDAQQTDPSAIEGEHGPGV